MKTSGGRAVAASPPVVIEEAHHMLPHVVRQRRQRQRGRSCSDCFRARPPAQLPRPPARLRWHRRERAAGKGRPSAAPPAAPQRSAQQALGGSWAWRGWHGKLGTGVASSEHSGETGCCSKLCSISEAHLARLWCIRCSHAAAAAALRRSSLLVALQNAWQRSIPHIAVACIL